MFDDVSVIPEGLDEMEPGPFLAAILSTVDVDKMSGFDRVVVLRALKRMASHYDGRTYQAMAAVADASTSADDDLEAGYEAAAFEVRAALRLTRRAADAAVGFADSLKRRHPRVSQAMITGDVDMSRARVMVNETAHLSKGTARDVIDQVIEKAPGLTTGQFRALIRRLCIQVNPEEAAERYDEAVADRLFITEPTEYGTGDIHLFGAPANKAAAAADHVNRLAKTLRRSGETRSMDQLRADVAIDLLCGNPVAKPTRRGIVDIHVDLETLTGLAETPGELAGYGPVVADIARQVAENQVESEWRWTLEDPQTGMITGNGTTRRRRADTSQQRHVQTRNHTCVFPGCRMPATQCDIDHIEPWAQTGRTTTGKLAPGCRHDHVGRHKHGWTYQPLPGGDHLWTSPLGHQYTTSGRSPP